MNEPQVWTLIGVFSTVLFAVFATTSGYIVRAMNAGFDRVDSKIVDLHDEMNTKIDSLREEMNTKITGLHGEMNARIGGLHGEMNARFAVVDVKFDRIDDRFDHLDRDVQAISRRVFPDV